MIKKVLFYALFICFGCRQADCPEGINKLPVYGQIQKCKEQLDNDYKFLQECDKQFKDRQAAAKFYVDRGWGYFYKNQFDTAMMRFNQAWLLDSLNADVYWGLGNIVGLRDKKLEESLTYFEKSLKIDPTNPRVWECSS